MVKLENMHLIKNVIADSIAAEMGIVPGDMLLEINGTFPEDVFDYQFMATGEDVELLILKPDGEEWVLEIEKEENEDLGLEFENGLMDEYRSCQNQCIFCFIDQMPPGLRETLYFKDDDARLSFLQGNYVTLTNMSEHDIQRIIRYHLEPINISIHTTDPSLRTMMLGNRFAGEALKKIELLYQAGIAMNGQIVLCKGINDGSNLKRTIHDLSAYLPYLKSVSVVPAGLTKYREGLYPLRHLEQGDATKVLDLIHDFQRHFFKKHGLHFIHAADEWYLLAGTSLPPAASYDGYPQLENGVGMMRLLLNEFEAVLPEFIQKFGNMTTAYQLSMATGLLAYPYLCSFANRLMECFPQLTVHIYGISNHFFGERITVSGLLTATDLIEQLGGKKLGKCLLLPENILRDGEAIFLDGFTVSQVENALQVPIDIVKSSGRDLIEAVLNVCWRSRNGK